MSDQTVSGYVVADSSTEHDLRSTQVAFSHLQLSEMSERLDADPRVSGPRVVVRNAWSSLNYKDALAMQGHPGVAKRLPLVPGIDIAGVVESSESDRFQAGDEVMIFHALFGTEHHGGFSTHSLVPDSWLYRLPDSLSMRDAMIVGTAGFTAAQCVDELVRHDVQPDSGEIIVTGATGGVGVFAVNLLSQLGYDVVAVTGKPDRVEWLKELGANSIMSREDAVDTSARPLLKSRWAGAVDTVGGSTLATILRSTRLYGCVTACGLVGGIDLNLTVYPFILRGVTLQGVDTANISYSRRQSIWEKIAGEWRPLMLEQLAIETSLSELPSHVETIMKGGIAGRVVVKI